MVGSDVSVTDGKNGIVGSLVNSGITLGIDFGSEIIMVPAETKNNKEKNIKPVARKTIKTFELMDFILFIFEFLSKFISM